MVEHFPGWTSSNSLLSDLSPVKIDQNSNTMCIWYQSSVCYSMLSQLHSGPLCTDHCTIGPLQYKVAQVLPLLVKPGFKTSISTMTQWLALIQWQPHLVYPGNFSPPQLVCQARPSIEAVLLHLFDGVHTRVCPISNFIRGTNTESTATSRCRYRYQKYYRMAHPG